MSQAMEDLVIMEGEENKNQELINTLDNFPIPG
jgi:hypothetical protein